MALYNDGTFNGLAFSTVHGGSRQDAQQRRIVMLMVFQSYADYNAMQAKVCKGVTPRRMMDGSFSLDTFGGTGSGTLTYTAGSFTAALMQLSAVHEYAGYYRATGDFVTT